LEDEESILKTYPSEVKEFAASRRPLIVANAFQIVFYRGVDLYGLDMCVEVVAALKESYPHVGLIFAVAEVGEAAYFEKIKRRIDELGIEDNFLFLTGQRELWPLFRRADLMVRPTCSDAYGISVAEADTYFLAVPQPSLIDWLIGLAVEAAGARVAGACAGAVAGVWAGAVAGVWAGRAGACCAATGVESAAASATIVNAYRFIRVSTSRGALSNARSLRVQKMRIA
jgi:glycosyltransferase involved in cell wall biosynthesis